MDAEHEEELRQCLIERWAYLGLKAATIAALLDLHGFKPRSGATPLVAQDPSGVAVASDPSGPEPVAADPITDYYQDRNNGAHAAKAP